jgi:hypothetical protein
MNDRNWEAEFNPLTDKFSNGYWPLYQKIITELSTEPAILELGVARGGSLQLWQAVFPEGLVAGLDNGSDGMPFWPPGTHKITESQDSEEGARQAQEISPEGYDMIVDDASHIGILSERSFDLYWPLVKSGGWYVFEDWAIGNPENAFHMDFYGREAPLRVAWSYLTKISRNDSFGMTEIYCRHGILAAHKAS